MSSTPFRHITIIGLGQIGSSFAKALREFKLCETITGADHDQHALDYGIKHGIIDHEYSDIAEAVKDADLILFSTPPGTYSTIMQLITHVLKPGQVLMDVGSVKRRAILDIEAHLPKGVHFVPAHPIAGSEKSGIAYSRADFFDKHMILLTPEESALQLPHVQSCQYLWEAMAGRVEVMPAELHDLLYAYVSHLPQLLAYASARALENAELTLPGSEFHDLIFRRFIRIGESDPVMWRDVFLENRDNVHLAAREFMTLLKQIMSELKEERDESQKAMPHPHAETLLFPRIIASCQVTTASMFEQRVGFKVLPFAAGGFVDTCSPMLEDPEDSLALISDHYEQVGELLGAFANALMDIIEPIENEDNETLLEQLTLCQQAKLRIDTLLS